MRYWFNFGACSGEIVPVIAPSSMDQNDMSCPCQPLSVRPSKIGSKPSAGGARRMAWQPMASKATNSSAESFMWGICMAGVGEARSMSFYMSAEFFDTTGRRGPHGGSRPVPLPRCVPRHSIQLTMLQFTKATVALDHGFGGDKVDQVVTSSGEHGIAQSNQAAGFNRTKAGGRHSPEQPAATAPNRSVVIDAWSNPVSRHGARNSCHQEKKRKQAPRGHL